MTEDEERHADEVNMAFQMGAERERKQSKARIDKLEAALRFYVSHGGEIARKALEGKDD